MMKAVLTDTNFVLRESEITALVGPSGSGKSSLIDTLALVRRPLSGEISINGQATSHLSESKRSAIRRVGLGYVFQSFNLIHHLSAIENVEIACAAEERDPFDHSQSLLSQFGINRSDWNSLPSQLSVGQRQRVSMARAMAGNPKIILADEPTGNLDEGNVDVVVETLREFAHLGGTVLMATHSRELAGMADRVLTIEGSGASTSEMTLVEQ